MDYKTELNKELDEMLRLGMITKKEHLRAQIRVMDDDPVTGDIANLACMNYSEVCDLVLTWVRMGL